MRVWASVLIMAVAAASLWAAGAETKAGSSTAGIRVSFKMDPRLASGVYGGEQWVSPPDYVTTQSTVEARVRSAGVENPATALDAEWIPADPGMITVSPTRGDQVKITVHHPGRSTLNIRWREVVKELAVKAVSQDERMQVEIAQLPEAPAPAAQPAANQTAGTRETFKRPKDTLSYAIGANLGSGLRREAVEVDSDLVMRGLQDALAGKDLLISQHEISVAIAGLKRELTSKRIVSAAEKIHASRQLADQNKKEGEAFLAKNKTKEGVVTLESGLQYRILKPGAGRKPAVADTVVCHYRGTLIDGTEFESSYKNNKPATLPLPSLIRGWSEALQLMPQGSKWQIFMPPELAYGERGGANGLIGPSATLIFEVELIGIQGSSGSARSAKNQAGFRTDRTSQ